MNWSWKHKNLIQRTGVMLFKPVDPFSLKKIGRDFIYIISGCYFNL